MTGRGIIPPSGPVGANIGLRRDLSQAAGLANTAYRPPSQLTRAVPSTVPMGLGTSVLALGAPIVANRAYVARIKGIEDDIAVATVFADMGTPDAGTAVAGVALYEVVQQDGATVSGYQAAYALRLLPGCSWFASVDTGSFTPGFAPAIPTVLMRSRSYAAAVVWSSAAVCGAGSGVVLNTAEIQGLGIKASVTQTTGFPALVPVDLTLGTGNGTRPESISFRVRIEPARPSSLYTEFF